MVGYKPIETPVWPNNIFLSILNFLCILQCHFTGSEFFKNCLEGREPLPIDHLLHTPWVARSRLQKKLAYVLC